jgi:Kef-type K+ transport system membrane component KefB/nucleotide-binding universal stress UspA family protein
MLLLQIATVLVVSRAVGFALRRVGQPLVVAEIVAGILLGPSAFGAWWPDAMATVFPPGGLAWLEAVSQLGLVLFMFTVGLEFDPGHLRARGTLAMKISQSGIVVPLALGAGLATWLHPRFAPPGVGLTGFALFMGAAMCVTAFPVLARILAERGMNRTRVGGLALAAAAIDDVTAWCLLAFVIALVRAGDVAVGLRTTALAAVFIAVMLGVVRPFLARVARRWGTRDTLGQTAIASFLLGLLASALVSELIGIHALFGAFAFGAVVPREGPVVKTLVQKVEDLVVILFLPTFFAFTGLRTRLDLVDGPDAWIATGMVIAVAMVAKILGTAIPARLSGLNARESATIGVLMNTRGLMELVVLSIGRDLGVLSPTLYTIMVLMAVVTTLVTSPGLRLLYPPSRVLAETAPQAVATRTDTVLACASHPETAAGLGALLGALSRGGATRPAVLELDALGARASLFPQGEGFVTAPAETGSAARAVARATGVDDRVDIHTFASGDPGRDIVAFAERIDASCVLLGLHRPLVGTARLGGTTRAVLAGLRCDAGVLHASTAPAMRAALVVRGGEHDAAIARMADRLRAAGFAVREHTNPSMDEDVSRLVEACSDHDLVVIGAGRPWGLEASAFDLRQHPILDRLPCALLIMHSPSIS